jgi:hypothetical protein
MKHALKSATTLVATLMTVGSFAGGANAATLLNGSFEEGFTNWVTSDLASPFQPLTVRENGYSPGFDFFSNVATQGANSATHGFDGGGPGTISIAQDVGTIDFSSSRLTFDYRVAWDMFNFGGSSQDRVFSVVLRPSGGGTALATFEVVRANPGTVNLDSGALSGSVDLSAYIGTDAQIAFEAFIPEQMTGPAYLQLDNVVLSAVPEPSSALLIGLGAFGLVSRRRRSH